MNENKIILDLCGGTGAWSSPYKEAGYDVRVITLPEYDIIERTALRKDNRGGGGRLISSRETEVLKRLQLPMSMEYLRHLPARCFPSRGLPQKHRETSREQWSS